MTVLVINLTISRINYNLEIESIVMMWTLRQGDNMALIQILGLNDTCLNSRP